MITKTYPIITIDITQIIDSILNQNLSFVILKLVHWIGPNRTKWAKIDRIRPNGLNRLNIPNWTDVNQMDRIDRSRLNWTRMDRRGPNWTEVNEGDWMDQWTEVNWIDQTRPIWYVSSLMITWTMDLRCNWQRMLLALPIWNDPVEKHGLKWKDARSPMGDQQCS